MRVHPRIRPARHRQDGCAAKDALQGFREGSLDRPLPGLLGPPAEPRPVVGDHQLDHHAQSLGSKGPDACSTHRHMLPSARRRQGHRARAPEEGVGMVKRLAAVTATAIVGVGMWAGLVSASSNAAPSGLRFTSKATASGYVDNPPKGLSPGDLLTEHSVWYRSGKKAGTMATLATVTLRHGPQSGDAL